MILSDIDIKNKTLFVDSEWKIGYEDSESGEENLIEIFKVLFFNKKPLNSSEGGTRRNYNLSDVINVVCKEWQKTENLSLVLKNLQYLNAKVEHHNKRLDVRLLSKIFPHVKCPNLDNDIEKCKKLLGSKNSKKFKSI